MNLSRIFRESGDGGMSFFSSVCTLWSQNKKLLQLHFSHMCKETKSYSITLTLAEAVDREVLNMN